MSQKTTKKLRREARRAANTAAKTEVYNMLKAKLLNRSFVGRLQIAWRILRCKV